MERLNRLAAFLALVLKPGDTVALNGELGAGKTTFARAVIRQVTDDAELDIPSPTFALVQSYECARLRVAHVDCYRMNGPDELEEIGLDEALGQGAALIEWAGRISGALPADRLEVTLAEGPTETTREVMLEGHGTWKGRMERLRAMIDFCDRSQWSDANPRFLQGDASTRAYARLHRNGETAVLMDWPQKPDGPPVRNGKPYSRLAHLAENVRPYVAVAHAFTQAGLCAPKIMDHDLDRGFLIIGDLGDRLVAAEPGDEPTLEEIYMAAADALVHLAGHEPPDKLPLPDGTAHRLPPLDREVFETEASLLVDWFYPAVYGQSASNAVRAAFLDALRALYAGIEGQDEGWVVRDFHSPNLLWVPEGEGIGRIGVIDFQDALRGHRAYDLVSLLQDARRDVPAELEARVFAHYCEARARADSGFDAQAFAAAYAVFGAQRNSKIVGIFARLAKRDGKHGYLAHIPRVSAYLERDLAHPALGTLSRWFAEHLPVDVRARPLDI